MLWEVTIKVFTISNPQVEQTTHIVVDITAQQQVILSDRNTMTLIVRCLRPSYKVHTKYKIKRVQKSPRLHVIQVWLRGRWILWYIWKKINTSLMKELHDKAINISIWWHNLIRISFDFPRCYLIKKVVFVSFLAIISCLLFKVTLLNLMKDSEFFSEMLEIKAVKSYSEKSHIKPCFKHVKRPKLGK